MTKAAADTLFYPFETGVLQWPDPPAPVVFWGARSHPSLRRLERSSLILQQYFKPEAQALETQGYSVFPELRGDGADEKFNMALVLLDKNQTQNLYTLAKALRALEGGGAIVCAADNKAGGTRVEKMLRHFGVKAVRSLPKNKARAAWGIKETLDEKALKEALQSGAVQPVLGGAFQSQPGVFGWNKIDKGSEILTRYLPGNLAGNGADFGCGYGFLSRYILERCPNIQSLSGLDADARAVALYRENLGETEKVHSHWADLTQALPGLSGLDFVVMNPPFHEGKKADPVLGQAFIKTAAQSLRPGGTLWMVANAALPYEEHLNSLYKSCRKKYEGQGFKVFQAVR